MPAFTALTALATSLGASAAGAGGAAAASAGAAGAAAGGASSLAGVAGTAGALATVAGTGLQFYGQQQQAKAAEKAESLREAQMNIEATRQRRQVIRQSLIARGNAVNAATSQGASEGSGLAGGLGQITSQGASNIASINSAQGLGSAMFATNRQASQGATMSSVGAGLSSFGGALFNNQQQIGRLGTYFA